MKARFIKILSLGILLVWIGSQRDFWDPGPSYQGISLVRWLSEANRKGSDHSKDAVKHFGTEAVPYILRNLRSNSSWPPITGKTLYEIFWEMLYEQQLDGLLPKPFYPSDAIFSNTTYHLISIGPDVLPTLTELLNSPYPAVKACAIYAIQEFQEIGIGGDTQINGLIQALNDDDEFIRYLAIGGLKSFKSLPAMAVDPLLNQLRLATNSFKTIPTEEVQASIIGLFGNIGPPASNAVSVINEFYETGSSHTRIIAIHSLWKIQRNTSHVLPLVMNAYTNAPTIRRNGFNKILSEMGSEAEVAIPLLVESLSHDDLFIQISSARTLLKIDPTQSGVILQWLISLPKNSPHVTHFHPFTSEVRELLMAMPIIPARSNLIELVGHPFPNVRSAASDLLSIYDSTNTPKSVELLLENPSRR